jgi:hypothetical protein
MRLDYLDSIPEKSPCPQGALGAYLTSYLLSYSGLLRRDTNDRNVNLKYNGKVEKLIS